MTRERRAKRPSLQKNEPPTSKERSDGELWSLWRQRQVSGDVQRDRRQRLGTGELWGVPWLGEMQPLHGHGSGRLTFLASWRRSGPRTPPLGDPGPVAPATSA